ncbi:hypothetical protein MIND_00002300 [Mycena indigotica]|uniref:Uncharacterized protein n=1 Tax=Mycena indigotica TaxID=2126181 RepID=A0A8H6TCF2_9AGAR|nr:uncharacterized protein MIND_00002300 [Mycena indigotica]KAF7314886.1 hypothetical protein MIND_00002300 [Mycena indigotica]
MDDILKLFNFLRQGGTVNIELQLDSNHIDDAQVKRKMKDILSGFYIRVPPADERRQEIRRQGLLDVKKVIDAGITYCNEEGYDITVDNIILAFSNRVLDIENPDLGIRRAASTETLDGPAEDNYKFPEGSKDDKRLGGQRQ